MSMTIFGKKSHYCNDSDAKNNDCNTTVHLLMIDNDAENNEHDCDTIAAVYAACSASADLEHGDDLIKVLLGGCLLLVHRDADGLQLGHLLLQLQEVNMVRMSGMLVVIFVVNFDQCLSTCNHLDS